MVLIGSFRSPPLAWPPVLRAGPEADPIVVRLRGEHDCSTDDALCLELARAIALNDAALVLDLSEVEFIERVDPRGHRQGPRTSSGGARAP